MRRLARATQAVRGVFQRRWCASSTSAPTDDAMQRCVALMAGHGGTPQFFAQVCGGLPTDLRSRLAREALEQECEARLVQGDDEQRIEQLVLGLPTPHVNVLGVAVVSKHLGGNACEQVRAADIDSDGVICHAEFRRWLHTGVGEEDPDVERPNSRQLSLVTLNAAIPFIVFGLLDNSIMIVGGDVVDDCIGSVFSLSTLACAALANTFADVFGISVGNSVEALTSKVGMPQANLSAEQRKLKVVRRFEQLASSGGILIGCILGMFPLLWIDKDMKRIEALFDDMDFDKDGLLTLSECQNLLMDLGLTQKRVPLEVTQTALHQFNVAKISLGQFVLAYKEIQVIHEEMKRMKMHSIELKRAAEAKAK